MVNRLKDGAFLILLASLLVISCNTPLHNKQEVTEYLNDPKHGLKVELEVKKIKTAITFRPWQLVAFNVKDKPLLVNNIKKKLYFVFRLSLNGKELLRQLPTDQYSEMVQVLAFRMPPFISISPDGQKAIEAEDCLFQQTYGMAKENELLLVFDKSKLENAQILNIKIKEFGLNIGNLNFQIRTSDIKNIPAIIF